MKEFVVYTAMRVLLFVAAFAVIAGIWGLIDGHGAPWFPVAVLALVVSGVASYFVLDRQRSAFAARVERRAAKASEAFERMRSKEDAD